MPNEDGATATEEAEVEVKPTKKKKVTGKTVKVEDTNVYKKLEKEHDKTKALLKDSKKKVKLLTEEVEAQLDTIKEMAKASDEIWAKFMMCQNDLNLNMQELALFKRIVNKLVDSPADNLKKLG